MKEVRFETPWGTDTLAVSVNDLAENAHASVLVSVGDTVVLVTAVMGGVVDLGYLPLKVDVEERFYATGAIMGSQYTRREGVSDEATVTARAVDRALRPLFPKHLTRDVHIVGTVLSLGAYDPDSLIGVGASVALSVSDIPWNGPLGYARVGFKDNTITLHPTRNTACSGLILCAGNTSGMVMIEGDAEELDADTIEHMLSQGLTESARIASFIASIQEKIGKTKINVPTPTHSAAMVQLFETAFKQELVDTLFSSKDSVLAPLIEKWVLACKDLEGVTPKLAHAYFDTQIDGVMHEQVLKRTTRVDGRTLTDIRPLFAQAGGIAERLHGVGLFYRGITHVLSVLTLGPLSQALSIETMEEQGIKAFIHHYNFPPFAPGETGRLGPNRRSIGHGRLVEKALKPVLPSREVFPYAIRIVSECLASGGSTSMASTCASTLALIDAGVPITNPVVGIAMGLITDGTKYLVLTDVQGPEDHHGDMDLKVTGTTRGITALQMDIKVTSIPLAIVVKGITDARTAHTTLLASIQKAALTRGTEPKKSVPRTERILIPEEKVGLVIGTHGKTVKGIEESTGALVHIRNGTAEILGTGEAVVAAKERILQILDGREQQTT